MKQLKKIKLKLIVLLIMGNLFFSHITYGAVYTFRDKIQEITLKYDVKEGYKINVSLDIKDNDIVFNKYFEADYGKPKVEFVDLNGDGLNDVFIKLTSEGQFTPYILINVANGKFVEALPSFKTVYFNYDIYNEALYSGVKKEIETQEYYLKDTDVDGCNELIFDNLLIDEKMYRNVIFYLDKTKTLFLLKKGEQQKKEIEK